MSDFLDETLGPLDRGKPLPDRTFLFVAPTAVRWVDGSPITVARIQDVRVLRNQDYVIRLSDEPVTFVAANGNLMVGRTYQIVDTGRLELDARIRFVDTEHELEIAGLLPRGGVFPLALRRGPDGAFVPQVTVQDSGSAGVNGVLLNALPRRWRVNDVLPFLSRLTIPAEPEFSARLWEKEVARMQRQGHEVPIAAAEQTMLRGPAGGVLDEAVLFVAAERALRAQREVKDTAVDRLGLVRVLVQTDRASEAWLLGRDLLEELPADVGLRVEMAQVAYLAGEHEESWSLLAPVLEEADILARSLCLRLRDAGVADATCSEDPGRRPETPRSDLGRSDGEDAELIEILEEPIHRVRIARRYENHRVQEVQIASVEDLTGGFELDVSVRVRGLEQVRRVAVWINPRGKSWLRVWLRRDGEVFRGTYKEERGGASGIYWYLAIETAVRVESLGGPRSPFPLDP